MRLHADDVRPGEPTAYPGEYWTYKGQPWMVIADRGAQALIINGEGEKKQVSYKNLTPTTHKRAKHVTLNGEQYLVTAKGRVFSLTTHRLMAWPKTDGKYKAIVERATGIVF